LNSLEQIVDRLHPRLSAELRLVKRRRMGDVRLRAMEHLVHRGDAVVDIGARRGMFTIKLARLVGPTGRVHAIEPYAPSVESLRRLRLANVTVHPVALSDRAGRAPLYVPRANGQPLDALASLTPSRVASTTRSVEVRPLDDLLADEPAPLGFIKCDAEGHELAVLRGAAELIARSMPSLVIVMEQRHQERSIQTSIDYLLGLGYAGYFSERLVLRPIADFDVAIHQLAFLTADFYPGSMVSGYVNHFLFVRPGLSIGPLTAS
jgi:FkbM family methyltransferase